MGRDEMNLWIIWPSVFLEIGQSETRIACGDHVC